MARLFDIIDCGSTDNNCFCLCLENALGEPATTYAATLNRQSGEMVDLAELVALRSGLQLQSSSRGQDIRALDELLKDDEVCLEVYHGCQGSFNAADTSVMFDRPEPAIVLGSAVGRKVRLLFHNFHYRRLTPAPAGRPRRLTDAPREETAVSNPPESVRVLPGEVRNAEDERLAKIIELQETVLNLNQQMLQLLRSGL